MGNAQATTLLHRPDIIASYSVQQGLYVVVLIVFVPLVYGLLVTTGVDGIVVQCVSLDAESQMEEEQEKAEEPDEG